MLELLLSILLALGIEFSDKQPLPADDNVIQKVQSSSDFEKLGGENALQEIINPTDEAQESSVVTDQTEPVYTN